MKLTYLRLHTTLLGLGSLLALRSCSTRAKCSNLVLLLDHTVWGRAVLHHVWNKQGGGSDWIKIGVTWPSRVVDFLNESMLEYIYAQDVEAYEIIKLLGILHREVVEHLLDS